jgi:mannosyl-oligosaccharide alpha-1,2-mannosidase
MSTMKIMGLEDLFQIGVNFSSHINFNQSQTSDTVSLFESTIRYVGGLLSAYELNDNQPKILVDKAQELTNKLILGFEGSVGVPFGFVDFSTGLPVITTVSWTPSADHVTKSKHVSSQSNVAEAGTVSLQCFG